MRAENKPKPIPPPRAGFIPALKPKVPPAQQPAKKPFQMSVFPRYDSMLHSNALKMTPIMAKFFPLDHARLRNSSAISLRVGILV